MNAEWIFFDLGSTLIDETEAIADRRRSFCQAAGISEGEYLMRLADNCRYYYDAEARTMKSFGEHMVSWHDDLTGPYPESRQVLRMLREENRRLGIIANQKPGVTDRLEKWRLLEYFDIIISSAEEGMKKPDRSIFMLALQRTGASAEKTFMIGDRLDNDIIPAKKLGMKTIWIKQGLYGTISPHSPSDQPDHQLNDINELMRILSRV